MLDKRTQKMITLVEEIKELEHLIKYRKQELDALKKNPFTDYDNVVVFAEKEYAKVNGYTKRISITGDFARDIITTCIEKELVDLTNKMIKLQNKL